MIHNRIKVWRLVDFDVVYYENFLLNFDTLRLVNHVLKIL